MELALKQAWNYQGLTYPNPAVGAVVTKDNQLLSVGAHQFAGGPHAEVYAIKTAYEVLTNTTIELQDSKQIHQFLLQNHNGIFKRCTIYSTLEPCNHVGKTPSCANLIEKLGFKRVVIGVKDSNDIAKDGLKRFKNTTLGVLEKECKELMEPFYIWQERAFILFKIAQTQNAKITGGYISSEQSLKQVHRLREKITQLVIGGNTVKVDRPTLDCRFVSIKAPNVQIYSEKKFDKDIKLFNIENREVTISKDISYFQKPGFVMLEGGENMLKSFADKIDWILTFQAPTLSSQNGYSADMQLQYLHTQKIDKDLMIWSKVKNG